jgi:superfamily II DNA or RNA helicase
MPTRKDGHHPIIFMQCGPIRFNVSARDAAAHSPFRHYLLPRSTNFRMPMETSEVTIQDIYTALVIDPERNQQIVSAIIEVVQKGLSPLVLTSRTEHVERLAQGLSTIENVLVLRGGMGKKQRPVVAEKLDSIPESVPRVILATGSYIGEGSMTPAWTLCF